VIPHRPQRLLLFAGLALLAAAFAGGRIVPLYDGVGFPDEPYRYLNSATPANGAEQTVTVASLGNYTTVLQTSETGPQFTANFTAGSITLPPGASAAHLAVEPAAPVDQPDGGKIYGNVYALEVSSSPRPPKINADQAGIALRLPQGSPGDPAPTVVFRTGGGGKWQPLDTTQVGADVYAGPFKGNGQYALAVGNFKILEEAKPGTKPHTASSPWPVLAMLATSLIVIIAILRWRTHRATKSSN
jgi:hypothetical protein